MKSLLQNYLMLILFLLNTLLSKKDIYIVSRNVMVCKINKDCRKSKQNFTDIIKKLVNLFWLFVLDVDIKTQVEDTAESSFETL